ncbi:hypothetical protein BASA81_006554 [Batrachochytrium salamandrivorans]|nr:hypothetical protein BASA81_006554 [Batrachochytrium salamandrivorans]
MQSWLEPDTMQAEYIKSRQGNLRCFPCCAEGSHRAKSFCGDSIKVRVEGQFPPDQTTMVGEIRRLGTRPSYKLRDQVNVSKLDPLMFRANYVKGGAADTRFSFNPNRRWRFSLSGKIKDDSQFCFTMFLIVRGVVVHVMETTPFKITPIWRLEKEDGKGEEEDGKGEEAVELEKVEKGGEEEEVDVALPEQLFGVAPNQPANVAPRPVAARPAVTPQNQHQPPLPPPMSYFPSGFHAQFPQFAPFPTPPPLSVPTPPLPQFSPALPPAPHHDHSEPDDPKRFRRVLLLWCALEAASLCNIPSSSCPIARPETGGLLAYCSNRGTCVNSACRCQPGWGDVDCSRQVRPLKLGAMMITQAAFDEAPNRYLDLVTSTFDAFVNSNVEIAPVNRKECTQYIFKTPLVPRWEVDFALDYSSVKLKIINGGIKVSCTMQVAIPSVALDVYVSTNPGTNTCCDTAGDSLYVATGGTQLIELAMPNSELVVNLIPQNLGFQLSCNLDAYPALLNSLMESYVINWGLVLNQQFTQAFTSAAYQYVDKFSVNGVQEFNATAATKVKAIATDISFIANSHVVINLEGYVRTKRFASIANASCPEVYTYYVDPNYEERFFPVPVGFDEFAERTKSGQVLQTMATGRVSRSAIKAAYWAALLDQRDMLNKFTTLSSNATLLDATYVTNIKWAIPDISFPITAAANSSIRASNTLRITVGNGDFEYQCANTGKVQGASVFARTTFDAYPIAIGNYTSGWNQNATFNFTAHVVSWDTSHFNMNTTIPEKLSVPNALVTKVFAYLLKSRLPTANEMLLGMAVPIPSALVRFAPGPRIQAKHDWDNQGADWGNGYLEFTSRCVCSTSQAFVSVETVAFGTEIVPRCVIPCSSQVLAVTGRRQLLEEQVWPILQPNPLPSTNQRRNLATLTSYASTGKCGPATNNPDLDYFRKSLSQLLTCATKKDYFSFSRGVVPSECMVALEPAISLGSCNPRASALNRNFSQCLLPMNQAYPLLFGKECIAGPFFTCDSTVAELFTKVCSCADQSDFVCREDMVAWIIIGAALSLVTAFWLIVLFAMGVCGSPMLRTAICFRVKMRKRDVWTTLLCLLAALVFSGGLVGWVYQDPIRNFTKEIVRSDLFRVSTYVQSEFNTFMVVWSMATLFFMAILAAQLWVVGLMSVFIGRSAWMFPVSQYKHGGNRFMPNDYLLGVWRQMAVITMRVLRFSLFALGAIITIPPMFYSFSQSVVVQEPQFNWIEASTWGENLTSIATSPETLNLLRSMVGFSLMSSAMGFISSALVFVLHGAVPGCFAAAQCMIVYINSKQRADVQLYAAYGNLLPPPDNSELDRWRRIIYLFIWCAHACGALGSSVAAILLFQALRAPPIWAICWLLCWVITIPCLVVGTSRELENRPFVNIILAIVYCGLFFILTLVMIAYSPGKAGFSLWFGTVMLVALFVLSFFFLLSEFINVVQKMAGETQVMDEIVKRNKIRLMEKMGVDVSKSPALLLQDFDWGRTQAMANKPGNTSPALNQVVASASNPLFVEEKKRVTATTTTTEPSSAPEPNAYQQYMAKVEAQHAKEMKTMMQMTSRDSNVEMMGQAKQQHADAMAKAADRLQNRARMSLALPTAQDYQAPMTPTFNASRLPPVPDRTNKPTMESFGLGRTPPPPARPSPQFSPSSPQLSPPPSPSLGLPPPARKPQAFNLPPGFAPVPLSKAQQKEAERMKRRISQRLAARGVKGSAAKELTERITLFHTMKMANEVSTAAEAAKTPSPLQRNVGPSSSTSKMVPQSSQASTAAPGPSASRSDKLQPAGNTQSRQQAPKYVLEPTFANAQATTTTGNQRMDDMYARQFQMGGNKPAWDGDDSFTSFLKEIVVQIALWFKSLITCGRGHAQVMDVGGEEENIQDGYFTKSERQVHRLLPPTVGGVRIPGWVYLSRMRTFTYSVLDVVFETREKMDPATYGLRIPGRRLLFIQGLALMFILLMSTTYNRISVQKLKNLAYSMVFATTDLELPSGVQNWPGIGNLTMMVDVPLESYVSYADISFTLLWVVWGLWMLSLVVEVTYSNFGRDMQEKRQGIKYARWISLSNLPLLLVIVIIPCVPDYVGLAIPGFYKLLPVCAPQFDAFLVGLAGDVFGVMAGSYLTFQTLFVLVLICPAFARALFFVVAREVLELRLLNTFEPRKLTNVTRKRLQNARFLWKVSPVMSPIITFLPMLLVAQIIGKTYVSILMFIFMGSPIVTALFSLKKETDDQRVGDWAIYSLIWSGLYAAPICLIMLVEALDRGQMSFFIQNTLGNWNFYIKLMCEVALAIVVTSDLLYIFMSSDDELEADVVISQYLEALNEEAEVVEVAQLSSSSGQQQVDRGFSLDV